MFTNIFSGTKNLFDFGDSGIELGLPKKLPESEEKKADLIKNNSYTESQKNEIEAYLNEEKKALEYLRDLLIGKTDFKGSKLFEEIQKNAAPREYLYLHFADGWKFSTDQSFLNRIRTEIDFFLKYL